MTTIPVPTIEEFRAQARAWLADNASPRPVTSFDAWGEGPDSVALFHSLGAAEERAAIEAQRAWIARKADAGFANLTWGPEWGGRGLPAAYERAFDDEERAFETPPRHEAVVITTHLVAPTILAVGTPTQCERHIRSALRTDELWCQLFSEPAAGSDLATLATRAERDGDGWVVHGQKVWTSGAQFADWGLLLCRTDPEAPKHGGITAFLVPMDAEGVSVRPLRQMTGGSSFNEVFFDGVQLRDDQRLGAVNGGWQVALAMLGFERNASTGESHRPTVARLIGLARQQRLAHDPVARQKLADAYTRERLLHLTEARVKAALGTAAAPGPEGSIGKLAWTESLRVFSDTAAFLLGPKVAADTGAWGTYAWSEHILGAPGYRIAGGTDEVQRNILAERVLGLPREPQADRSTPWRNLPR